MKRLTLSLLTLLITCSHVAAQSNPCSLATYPLPEVHGFSLGMSVEEVKQRYPNFVPPTPDKIGFGDFDYDFLLGSSRRERAGEERKEPLKGIDSKNLRAVVLAFLDERLAAFTISFNYAREWANVDEFLDALINTLKLPSRGAWTSLNSRTRRFNCTDYFIEVNISLPNATDRAKMGVYRRDLIAEQQKRMQEAGGHEGEGIKP